MDSHSTRDKNSSFDLDFIRAENNATNAKRRSKLKVQAFSSITRFSLKYGGWRGALIFVYLAAMFCRGIFAQVAASDWNESDNYVESSVLSHHLRHHNSLHHHQVQRREPQRPQESRESQELQELRERRYRSKHKKRALNAAQFAAVGSVASQIPCETENEICSTNNANICRNNTCVSACSLRGMRECVCDSEEENYCYLCCGNADNKCLPAHEHGILRNNGERWERESCARCRMNGAEMEGSACDDRDTQRLCLQGKCSKSVCHSKGEGEFCDRRQEKVCVDDVCDNPCARIASHLMVCDCPAIDPDTGFASEDRCQLCCYDFNRKPASRRCQNAFRKYRIANTQNRPIWRVGLECAGGKRCNRYGICASGAPPRASANPVVLMAFFFAAVVLLAVLAAVVTNAERF